MLRLAASLADHATVSLGEAITGIDERNVGLLINAVRHASGRRQSGGRPSKTRSMTSVFSADPALKYLAAVSVEA